MSKKKAAAKSTMTLKDFHGGSIPSDLPLPSAPGVTVRPPDRPNPWAPTRPDPHRPRPGSAGGSRALDLQPPFLPHIGRNFDEDERKPFDAPASSPRRPDPIRPLPVPKRPVSSPAAAVSHVPVPVSNPSGSGPNAWGAKNVSVEPVPPAATVWSGSKLACASAVEKVSSGKWHSKAPADVEVIKFQEVEGSMENLRIGESVGVYCDREREVSMVYFEATERENARSPIYQAPERNVANFYQDGGRPTSREGIFGGREVPQQGLNLMPRKNQMEPSEARVFQGYQLPPEPVHVERVTEIHGGMNVQRPGSAGLDGGARAVERPKLNLKPRSVAVDQSAEIAERERKSVFGGARPRELVLKERGIDNFAGNSSDSPSPPNRAKSDTLKTDLRVDLASPASRHGGRADAYSPEPSIGIEKRDFRPNTEKVDSHRASWRNDNHGRNTKDMEKQPESWRQEPETWRKPVEQPKPEVVPGPRPGKASSALELAQAFSRPATDTRITNPSLPGRTQVPFSRLTTQRQINGY